MAFSDDDLDSLRDDFGSEADTQITAPRAFERRYGGNAGFSHFSRTFAAPSVETVEPRKCARCREMVLDARWLCLRHRELHRIEQNERNRKRGRPSWSPDAPVGRPPDMVRRAAEDVAEVALLTSMLNDAHAELALLKRRIASIKGELTLTRKAARLNQQRGRQVMRQFETDKAGV